MNQVACPHCGMILLDNGSLAGQSVACPQCGGMFLMPVKQPAYAPPSIPVSPTIPSTFQGLGNPSLQTGPSAPPPFVIGSDFPAVGGGPSSWVGKAAPVEKAAKSNQSQVVIYVLAGLALVTVAAVLVLWIGGGSKSTAKRSAAASAKRVDDWIKQLQASASEADRRRAAEAIADLDSGALMAALGALTVINDGGKSYVVDKGAMASLVAVGPRLVDSLPTALRAKSENVRIGAAYLLREMGPSARKMRGALDLALDDESRWVRRLAAAALGNLGPDAAPSVPKLIQFLDHEDPYTRRDAVLALGQIGGEAKAAIPALKRVLDEDKILTVRQAAQKALAELEGSRDVAESQK